jgi:hypothetical protein
VGSDQIEFEGECSKYFPIFFVRGKNKARSTHTFGLLFMSFMLTWEHFLVDRAHCRSDKKLFAGSAKTLLIKNLYLFKIIRQKAFPLNVS